MSDLIYRSHALNAINMSLTINSAWMSVAELPSAQPERKMGKWITVNGRLGNEVECDNCHSVFWYWMGNYKFCPHCGARMDGESE